MDYLWTPWRYQYLTSLHKPSTCIFCAMAQAPDHDEETLVVFRGAHNFIVLNRFPYTSGHLMVVPYQHASDLAGIAEAAAMELMALTREAERHLKWLYHPDGINLGMNIGESAGAGIAGHIHMHVLPRWSGDSNFMTVVGETRVLGEVLPVTWQRLKEAFARPPEGTGARPSEDAPAS
jgi:ATP adenylyltransferase